MAILSHPLLAIAFGACMLCGETCLHFGDIVGATSWIDFPLHDWIAGGFLVYGGIASRRDWTAGRTLQAAAWAFMCSLLVGAFVGHWEEWRASTATEDVGWLSSGAFLLIIAVFLIISIGALFSTLARSRSAQH